MTYTRSIFAVLALLTFTTGISTKNSFNGCVEIQDGKCTQCALRPVLANGQGCGPLNPANNTCFLFNYDFIQKKQTCNGCKDGYALKVTVAGTKISQRCGKRTIPGCLLEFDVISANRNSSTCVACPNNTYSVLNRTTLKSTCQKIANPVPHCYWGSLVEPTGVKCNRCVDGYALGSLTKVCEKTVEKGCWIQGGGKCRVCNPFEGYSIDANGNCFKTANQKDSNSESFELVSAGLAALGITF